MELFRYYPQIDSTNKEAARLLASGEDLHGKVILTYHQTDGRGQYGRTWHAEPGNHLAMSIIIQPQHMMPADLPLLSMKVSLAVVRTLNNKIPSLRPLIKWPNDVYVNSKKLGGILIENSVSSSNVRHCIIGIGMNVNESSFPPEISNAISIYQLTNKSHSVEELASDVRNDVMNILDEPTEKWKSEYDSSIYGLGKQNSFELDGKIMMAVISGIDNEGKIILDTGDGKMKSYFSHEIKWFI